MMRYFATHVERLDLAVVKEMPLAQTKCSIFFVLQRYCCKNALERHFKYYCLTGIIPLEITVMFSDGFEPYR